MDRPSRTIYTEAMPELLNMKRIGERLRIPYATVRWMRQEGKLPEPDQVVSPRVILWLDTTIDAWDAAGRPAPNGEPDGDWEFSR